MDDQAIGLSRLHDLARGALYQGAARFSRFLDPAQARLAAQAARDMGAQVCFFGGYSGAERVVGGFYDMEPPPENQFPVSCVKAVWNARYGQAAHRDLLGAQMALGLERGVFGDIVVGEGEAFLFVLDEATSYVTANLESAGRASLRCEVVRDLETQIPSPKGRTIRVTLSSMRLDALVAAAYDLSRQDSQRLIERELVKINHLPTEKTDARVEPGDLLSVRGQGRLRVLDEPSPTKKGRLAVNVFLYGE